jgi:hypothetical protein
MDTCSPVSSDRLKSGNGCPTLIAFAGFHVCTKSSMDFEIAWEASLGICAYMPSLRDERSVARLTSLVTFLE